MADCRDIVTKQTTYEIIAPYTQSGTNINEVFGTDCVYNTEFGYAVAYYDSDVEDFEDENINFGFIPKCFGLMQEEVFEEIGINRLNRLPGFNLRGSGVIIGFVDTGIDYTHPVFVQEDDTSRILSIWDQSLDIGAPPFDYFYGTEFTREMLNQALTNPNPLEIVPTADEDGHGTFLAGVAAGGGSDEEDYEGAASLADIVVVKLKPAKDYIKRYFCIDTDAPCYMESDIIMGVDYLVKTAQREGKPLVICIGLGNSLSAHNGMMILDEVLSNVSGRIRNVAVCAAGNEGNKDSHYRGGAAENIRYEDVQLRVGEDRLGFTIALWGRVPAFYSIGIISPSGDTVNRIEPRTGLNTSLDFLFERTTVRVQYEALERQNSEELILMRFEAPAGGIWTIRVFYETDFRGVFDMWLPISDFKSPDTYFLLPDPYITLTDPANSFLAVSVTAYNHELGSIYREAGLGYTSFGNTKPDVAAPGVNIYGPLPRNIERSGFGVQSGTSVAAALASGTAALLLEWAVVEENDPYISGNDIRILFINGASRKDILTYPNREWGYGSLDVFGAFEILRDT